MAFERGVPGARDPWPWSLREEPEIPTLPICHVILPCRCATVTLRPNPPPRLQTGATPATLALLLQLEVRCELWEETGVYFDFEDA